MNQSTKYTLESDQSELITRKDDVTYVQNNIKKRNSMCPTLSYTQRFAGWFLFFGTGTICSMGSTKLLKTMDKQNILKFAIYYTLSLVLSMTASLFMWGPWEQLKFMFEKTRRGTTIVFLCSIVVVMTCCIVNVRGGNIPRGVILILVAFQQLAYIWYNLSFVPYLREILCCECLKEKKEEEEDVRDLL